MSTVLLWIKIHCQRGPVFVVLGGTIVELLIGGMSFAFPYNPLLEVDVRLGLFIPLVTIGGCVLLLFSDLTWLERRYRRGFRLARLAWVLTISGLALAPALIINDSFESAASLRNRAFLLMLGVVFALVLRPQLAITPGLFVLSFGMLTSGRTQIPSAFGSFLLEPDVSESMLQQPAIFVAVAATVYVIGYPGVHRSRET